MNNNTSSNKSINNIIPKSAGIIDTLVFTKQTVNRGLGNNNLNSLLKYFNLKSDTHRSLDDCYSIQY